MSTTTLRTMLSPSPNQTPTMKLVAGVLFTLLLLLTWGLWAMPVAQMARIRYDGQDVEVKYNRHAIEEHGSEAESVRRGCEKNGSTMTFKKKDEERYMFLCQLEDGRYGIQIIEKINDLWQEVSSFVPKDGSLAAVRDYVLRFATRFTGKLP